MRMFVCNRLLMAVAVVSAGLLPARAASAQANAALAGRLAPLVAAHHGKVALYAEELRSGGRSVALDADTPVQTASVIKLAILYEAMVQVRAGQASWSEPIVLPAGEAVGGSGMLHFFDGPMKLTLKDVLTMMVIVSDNTATNLAIDRFGVDAVNARMVALGLPNTHLYKKVFKPATGPMPADQPKFGLGKTTPREIAALMTVLGECRLHEKHAIFGGAFAAATEPVVDDNFLVPKPPPARPRFPAAGLLAVPIDEQDKAVCAVALDMLKSQFYRETIPRYLPGGGEGAVASKTGSLDAVRADVAIVAGKTGPMVLAIFTYDNADHGWTVDNEGEVTIAKLARVIVDAWSPDGLDTKQLVPGLGLPLVK